MSDPTIESEAIALGWAPLEEWRGDAKAWVDAETFVERGHTVMPILKKNNQELLGKLTTAQTELTQVKAALAETNASIKALTDFQAAEVKRQVEAQVADLRSQIREARKDGDDELVDTLSDQLDETKGKLKAASEPLPSGEETETPGVPGGPVPPEPWAIAFAEENKDWFGKDKKRTALVIGIAEELKETTALRGAELLAKAKAEMLEVFEPQSRESKAEGGSRGGGAPPASSSSKTFSNLPPEAKEVVRSQERLMVGKGKPFKDAASWQKHFVEVYFAT